VAAAALQRIKAIAPGLVIMASATAYIRESTRADAASFSTSVAGRDPTDPGESRSRGRSRGRDTRDTPAAI